MYRLCFDLFAVGWKRKLKSRETASQQQLRYKNNKLFMFTTITHHYRETVSRLEKSYFGDFLDKCFWCL